MRKAKVKLMLTFGVLSLLLASCAHQQIAGDSYCQVYAPIIQQKGDGAIAAAPWVKRRILYNEQMYRNECSAGGKK